MNWKNCLQKKFGIEGDYGSGQTYCMYIFWRDFLIFKKSLHISYFNKGDDEKYQSTLNDWYEFFIINYDDLMHFQQKRIDKQALFADNPDVYIPGIDDFMQSVISEYAIIKQIKIYDSPKGTYGRRLNFKAVICKLL